MKPIEVTKIFLQIISIGLLWSLFSAQSIYADSRPVVIPYYTIANYDQAIEQIYAEIGDEQQIDQRIHKISEYFLGKPYLLGALGEGPSGEFDKNPLYRTDAFDCTTFVTTVLALAEANNLQEFKQKIKDIRYLNSTPDFFNSHRFISIDWNVDNQRKGYIKDITNQFSVAEKTTNIIIDKPAWYKKLKIVAIKTFTVLSHKDGQTLLDNLHQRANDMHPQPSRIKYIPLSELFSRTSEGIVANMTVFEKIPDGAIIEIVSSRWDLTQKIGTSLNISHMGFAIRTSQGLMFRNASSVYDKVVDVPLEEYLAHSYEHLKHPETKGIHIELPLKPA